ncbi:MAG TPA: TlyA family RNA methyltransferase [Desulfomonilaceae bacterium]|nr:TlyA family RNA methyltransferase [Desulfomonilaceae bacterium]
MTHKTDKCRIDALLTERGLVPSRHKARALIMAGKVLVDGVKVEKPGKEVSCEAEIAFKEVIPYVSRGGIKLAAALDGFHINPEGLTVLDAGVSTGGFTHCLLMRGAARVVAVDVGYGQLDWSLRTDLRVILLERTNVRFLEAGSVPYKIDSAVADLSFISLKIILPKIRDIVAPGGWIVPLVKPQFEVGRADVGKSGVVRDPEKIRAAVEAVKSHAKDCGLELLGELESPIKGPKGNREFFLHLRKPS